MDNYEKEIRHILRDPLTLALIIALPAALLILLGYGITGESKGMTLAIVDLSKSDASRAYIERFTASDDFRLTQSIQNEDELKLKIDLDEVDVGIIIPPDFGRNISGNKPSRVMILVDGSTNPSDVSTAQLKLASISEMASQELLFQRITTSGMAGR